MAYTHPTTSSLTPLHRDMLPNPETSPRRLKHTPRVLTDPSNTIENSHAQRDIIYSTYIHPATIGLAPNLQPSLIIPRLPYKTQKASHHHEKQHNMYAHSGAFNFTSGVPHSLLSHLILSNMLKFWQVTSLFWVCIYPSVNTVKYFLLSHSKNSMRQFQERIKVQNTVFGGRCACSLSQSVLGPGHIW